MLLQRIEALADTAESEKIRLRIERFKAIGTVISIVIPLLAVLISVVVNMFLQEKRARMDFELKAVEVVMNASSPAAAANKAIVLQELFPGRLSPQFHDTFERLYGVPERSGTP